ncbi:DDE-type integrase/transposase/recombinase [Halalkalicoccus sp. NIPERK01]|uniref:DDE-type integrase/transposase/recombinase n=1 Tax=Halalkalicoccus sp. NIPERK01 TaxID=3053469 RepID=UPI0034E9770D
MAGRRYLPILEENNAWGSSTPIRWGCRSGKRSPSLTSLALIARIKRSLNERRFPDSAPDSPRLRRWRVAVDETVVRVTGEWYWLYAAVDLDSKLLLAVELSRRRGHAPAAASLKQLHDRYDLSATEFRVDGMSY